MQFKEWLNYRYGIDAKARNRELENLALNCLQDKNRLKVVDFGSGTGSNFRYYHQLLAAQDQRWILVDRDQELLNEALNNIAHIFGEVIQREPNSISIRRKEYRIEVKFVVMDIFGESISNIVGDADLILSNALFDLASKSQFDSFCKDLPLDRSVFLSTLNYEDTVFAPVDDLDGHVISLFHHHMSREQSFGRSMGVQCVSLMQEILAQHREVHLGPSHWVVDSGHEMLQKGLLEFINQAVVDLGAADEFFKDWLAKRREQLDNGHLSMKVSHSDILTLP